MPLVAHTPLPTFDHLRQQGQEILTLEHAIHQDIRELHIGLLNMMPDAALTVTEQQFMRLMGVAGEVPDLTEAHAALARRYLAQNREAETLVSGGEETRQNGV